MPFSESEKLSAFVIPEKLGYDSTLSSSVQLVHVISIAVAIASDGISSETI
jgi:hypothetical protein